MYNVSKIIVLCGEACSGKDSIMRMMVHNEGYQPCVSHTTRPMREGEVEGREYYFMTTNDFLDKLHAKDFVEVREYNTVDGLWLYGMSYAELDSKLGQGDIVMILDIKGMLELKQSKYRDMIVSFYINVDENTRLERYLNRDGGLTLNKVEECVRRLKADRKDFEDAEKWCDYTIKPITSYDGMQRILDILGK